MMRTTLSYALALALFAVAAPLPAHHSFAAEFDQTKVVMLNGTITVMEWVNPHAMIHLAVKNEDGTVTDWMIEGNTPNSLLRAGLTKKTLQPGTRIAVRGYRARSGDHIASGSAIMFADGKKLALGSGADAGKSTVLDWVSSDEDLWKRQLALLRGEN